MWTGRSTENCLVFALNRCIDFIVFKPESINETAQVRKLRTTNERNQTIPHRRFKRIIKEFSGIKDLIQIQISCFTMENKNCTFFRVLFRFLISLAKIAGGGGNEFVPVVAGSIPTLRLFYSHQRDTRR